MGIPHFRKIITVVIVIGVLYFGYMEVTKAETGTAIDTYIEVKGENGVLSAVVIEGARTSDISKGTDVWFQTVLTDVNGIAYWECLAGFEYTWRISADGYQTVEATKTFWWDGQIWAVTLEADA
jgi:hypothetical protein